MRFMSLVFTLSVVLPLLTIAQAQGKFPVEVEASGSDMVGNRLAYLVREGIRKSSSMRLTDENELRMMVILVTIDSDKINTGNSTTYSTVWCWNNPEQPFPFFITSSAGYCGTSRVESSAEGIVASTDKYLSDILKTLKDFQKPSKK